jgi:hypothetical protein
MKSVLVTWICGLGLLIPACFGLLSCGYPTELCPFPTLTIVPVFLLGSLRAAVFVPAILFFAWNPGLFRGSGTIPKRSYALLAIATALSACWFVGGWKYGLEYEGASYTRSVCFINILWLGSLWVQFLLKWKSAPSFTTNLLLHWFLFAWLAWYAFPYLGELP